MGKNLNPMSIIKKINKSSETAETYNTGLVGEHLIVGAYKTMPTDKLEKMRYIINKIIDSRRVVKKKKE